jgi:Ion channel
MQNADLQPSRRTLHRLSGVELLFALAAWFISFPFLEMLKRGPLIESILITFVLVSAVVAVAERRSVLIIAIVLSVPAMVGHWAHYYRPDLVPTEVFLIGGIAFVSFVIVQLLRHVLTAEDVDSQVLCASISAYLLLGLLWTFCYWLVAELIPGAFSFNTASGGEASMKGFDACYFSFITLCTVGYGDITPVAKVARMLAALEAMVGLLYVAVLIARLVAIKSESRPK